ncbi:TPA: LOW QUALITY PROTEIN: hypothetical protein N0F65_004688, partial [Lagenidium giganteum]
PPELVGQRPCEANTSTSSFSSFINFDEAKKMSPAYLWSQHALFTCLTELERALDTIETAKSLRVIKSQAMRCQVCRANPDAHKMQYILHKCDSATCPPGCPWRLKALVCANASIEPSRGGGAAAVLYECGQHINNVPAPRRGTLTRKMKRSVQRKVLEGLKPARIRNELFNEFQLTAAITPSLSRIQAYMCNFKRSKLHATDNVEDQCALVRRHRLTAFQEENQPFVLPDPWVGDGATNNPLLVGFSSKKLLQNLRFRSEYPLHVDGTFKLTKNGFPAIVVGMSDANRAFRVVAVYISSGLRQAFFCQSLSRCCNGLESMVGEPPRLKYIMADADDAQYNAAREVFGYNHIQLMCFFHVIMNVKKQASKKGVPQGLQHDILAPYFECATRLVRASFKRFGMTQYPGGWQNPFCERYFQSQWLSGRFHRWQCLYVASSDAPIATTNNPCQTFNKELKRDYSLLPLNTLAKKLLEMAAHISELFVTQAQPPSKLQSRTKRLQANNLLMLEPVDRMSLDFVMPTTEQNQVFVRQLGFALRQLGFALPNEQTKSYYRNMLEWMNEGVIVSCGRSTVGVYILWPPVKHMGLA